MENAETSSTIEGCHVEEATIVETSENNLLIYFECSEGYAANFWIDRYTALEISQLLRDKTLSFVKISDMFNFSSPAYFSRYDLHNLGVNPTEYGN